MSVGGRDFSEPHGVFVPNRGVFGANRAIFRFLDGLILRESNDNFCKSQCLVVLAQFGGRFAACDADETQRTAA